MAISLSCSARVGCGSSLHRTTEVKYRATLIFFNVDAFLDCGASSNVVFVIVMTSRPLCSARVGCGVIAVYLLMPPAAILLRRWALSTAKTRAKLERGSDVPESRNNQTLTTGIGCKMCHQETVLLFLSAKGVVLQVIPNSSS